MMRVCFAVVCFLFVNPAFAQSKSAETDTSVGDAMIADYFRIETDKLKHATITSTKTLEDWTSKRNQYKSQLMEMLGLDPLPEKTELKSTTTGIAEHEEFTVENLHFQSRPGLYVTGNLYLPKQARKEKLPAVLYVCGHGRVKKDGVSYGNKVHYHHHGSWFARNGYVCLTIDTLQLGEIEGIHHGTYREKMWWWLNRGYTPAGVEAWNCVRALDYLQSRPEVDGERIGVTGRSGGGAYSWWIAAIDDRIKCAVPVAGITDLQNYVHDGQTKRFADGCIEGHCDCMFMFNTYKWDYSTVAALVAPRPLMISNSDNDSIFPLDGVYRTYNTARQIYSLYGKPEDIAFNTTAGGHADTQQLRVNAFDWFNKHLKGKSVPIEKTADKFFEPQQLRVFETLPNNQTNSQIQETFVATAAPATVAETPELWAAQRKQWMQALRTKVFAGWPTEAEPLNAKEAFNVNKDGLIFRAVDFTSQNVIRLRLYIMQKATSEPAKLVVLNPLDQNGWIEFLEATASQFPDHLPASEKDSPAEFDATRNMVLKNNWSMAWTAPRGIGLTQWNHDEKKQTQHRRRFYLLGQSLDGMRTYDIRRAIQALRQDSEFANVPTWLQAHGTMGAMAMYASLFEKPMARIDLHSPPANHRNGPFLLNVRRFLDMPESMAIAASHSRVVLYSTDEDGWKFPTATMRLMDRESAFSIRN